MAGIGSLWRLVDDGLKAECSALPNEADFLQSYSQYINH
jgi:hypothetical protein